MASGAPCLAEKRGQRHDVVDSLHEERRIVSERVAGGPLRGIAAPAALDQVLPLERFAAGNEFALAEHVDRGDGKPLAEQSGDRGNKAAIRREQGIFAVVRQPDDGAVIRALQRLDQYGWQLLAALDDRQPADSHAAFVVCDGFRDVELDGTNFGGRPADDRRQSIGGDLAMRGRREFSQRRLGSLRPLGGEPALMRGAGLLAGGLGMLLGPNRGFGRNVQRRVIALDDRFGQTKLQMAIHEFVHVLPVHRVVVVRELQVEVRFEEVWAPNIL